MPHIGPFPFLVFFLWVPISAVIFAQTKPRKAAFLVFVWGTMVLPELVAFDAPILPPIDKHILVGACAFVGLLLTARTRWKRMRLLRGVQLFFWFFVIANIGTALTNPESYVFGGAEIWEGGPRYDTVVIPALSSKEFIPMSIQDFFEYLMPFAVGQMIVQSRDDAIVFLKSFVFACLCYVPLMLWEGAMSPQLHRQLYGYHALTFSHNVRGDGFKPTVWMASGLGVAMFQFIGLTGALILVRLREKVSPTIPAGIAVFAIFVALAVSRNVAVMLYAAAAIPVVLMMRPRTMTKIAFVLAIVFVSFPITRAKGWFPVDDIVAKAMQYSPERADSLAFRFENEERLLAHTELKPYFGWGAFNRNRVFDEVTGRDISITDGEWAIHYSVRGAVGAIGWFWLVALPILWATRMIKRVAAREDQLLLAGMAVTAAINAVDLLPNSSFTQFPFLYAGALAGYLQSLRNGWDKP